MFRRNNHFLWFDISSLILNTIENSQKGVLLKMSV